MYEVLGKWKVSIEIICELKKVCWKQGEAAFILTLVPNAGIFLGGELGKEWNCFPSHGGEGGGGGGREAFSPLLTV